MSYPQHSTTNTSISTLSYVKVCYSFIEKKSLTLFIGICKYSQVIFTNTKGFH